MKLIARASKLPTWALFALSAVPFTLTSLGMAVHAALDPQRAGAVVAAFVFTVFLGAVAAAGYGARQVGRKVSAQVATALQLPAPEQFLQLTSPKGGR